MHTYGVWRNRATIIVVFWFSNRWKFTSFVLTDSSRCLVVHHFCFVVSTKHMEQCRRYILTIILNEMYFRGHVAWVHQAITANVPVSLSFSHSFFLSPLSFTLSVPTMVKCHNVAFYLCVFNPFACFVYRVVYEAIKSLANEITATTTKHSAKLKLNLSNNSGQLAKMHMNMHMHSGHFLRSSWCSNLKLPWLEMHETSNNHWRKKKWNQFRCEKIMESGFCRAHQDKYVDN